eukprot:538358-Rhodomonas_salina.1
MARWTPQGMCFNKRMARVRISIENAFTDVLNKWAFVGYCCLQVLGSMPVAKHLHVAFFLHNCAGIFYGNLASTMFGHDLQAGLTLDLYIA